RRLRRASYTAKGKADALARLSAETELDQADRRELDDAVFALLGVSKKAERAALIDRLYDHLREFYESVRRKEEQASENKKRAAAKGPRPADIAKQIHAELADKHPALLRRYDPDFFSRSGAFDTYVAPAEGLPSPVKDELYDDSGVLFLDGKRVVDELKTRNTQQDALLVAVVRGGVRGAIRVPTDPTACDRLRAKWQKHVAERTATVDALIADRTADEATQANIRTALAPLLGAGG
ncbi:MAG: SAM-dependent methyltransferase, partial [Planctomycetota bacterium]